MPKYYILTGLKGPHDTIIKATVWQESNDKTKAVLVASATTQFRTLVQPSMAFLDRFPAPTIEQAIQKFCVENGCVSPNLKKLLTSSLADESSHFSELPGELNTISELHLLTNFKEFKLKACEKGHLKEARVIKDFNFILDKEVAKEKTVLQFIAINKREDAQQILLAIKEKIRKDFFSNAESEVYYLIGEQYESVRWKKLPTGEVIYTTADKEKIKQISTEILNQLMKVAVAEAERSPTGTSVLFEKIPQLAEVGAFGPEKITLDCFLLDKLYGPSQPAVESLSSIDARNKETLVVYKFLDVRGYFFYYKNGYYIPGNDNINSILEDIKKVNERRVKDQFVKETINHKTEAFKKNNEIIDTCYKFDQTLMETVCGSPIEIKLPGFYPGRKRKQKSSGSNRNIENNANNQQNIVSFLSPPMVIPSNNNISNTTTISSASSTQFPIVPLSNSQSSHTPLLPPPLPGSFSSPNTNEKTLATSSPVVTQVFPAIRNNQNGSRQQPSRRGVPHSSIESLLAQQRTILSNLQSHQQQIQAQITQGSRPLSSFPPIPATPSLVTFSPSQIQNSWTGEMLDQQKSILEPVWETIVDTIKEYYDAQAENAKGQLNEQAIIDQQELEKNMKLLSILSALKSSGTVLKSSRTPLDFILHWKIEKYREKEANNFYIHTSLLKSDDVLSKIKKQSVQYNGTDHPVNLHRHILKYYSEDEINAIINDISKPITREGVNYYINVDQCIAFITQLFNPLQGIYAAISQLEHLFNYMRGIEYDKRMAINGTNNSNSRLVEERHKLLSKAMTTEILNGKIKELEKSVQQKNEKVLDMRIQNQINKQTKTVEQKVDSLERRMAALEAGFFRIESLLKLLIPPPNPGKQEEIPNDPQAQNNQEHVHEVFNEIENDGTGEWKSSSDDEQQLEEWEIQQTLLDSITTEQPTLSESERDKFSMEPSEQKHRLEANNASDEQEKQLERRKKQKKSATPFSLGKEKNQSSADFENSSSSQSDSEEDSDELHRTYLRVQI